MDPEKPQDAPPDGSWRADALARSTHSRLDREVRPPGEDFDEERSLALCAEVARNLLGDFAPALVLLPVFDRERVQTLLAYAFTLFDFARQRGVEGERLSQINRWEFTLETALSAEGAFWYVPNALGARDSEVLHSQSLRFEIVRGGSPDAGNPIR